MSERALPWRLALGAALAIAAPHTGFADEGRRDPTRPPIDAPVVGDGPFVPASGESRVSSIVLSGSRRVAIVDGRRVGVGDLVASGEITAIEVGTVHVVGPEGPRTLPLFHTPPTKTPSATTGGNP